MEEGLKRRRNQRGRTDGDGRVRGEAVGMGNASVCTTPPAALRIDDNGVRIDW